MRVLFFIALLLVPAAAFPQTGGDSPVSAAGFGWSRDRKPAPKFDNTPTGPVREVINENRTFQRKAREQLSPGALDPNDLTVDGRSRELDRINAQSRALKTKDVDGYTYHAALQNNAENTAEVVYLEFRFQEIANPANVVSRQFLCSAPMKPGGKTDIRVFSTLGPSDVISFESLAAGGKLFNESVRINRVEFKNGAILQRKDWDFAGLRQSVERVTSSPWDRSETCRGL